MELRDFMKFNIGHTIIYYPEQIKILCDDIKTNLDYKITKKRKGAYVYNIPCSFDIETSSFYEGKEKRACMYMWSMSIAGLVIIGRTWEEFINVLEVIKEEFKLVPNERHMIFYIQNMSYEFQWCKNWLDWLEVFSIDTRKPIQALTSLGIEFKCSYVLSAFSLAKMGEHLTMIPVQKTDGLQYIALRHSKSLLNWSEIRYSVNDVQVVVSFIYEEIVKNGTITKIPLTNTGYVRSFCRKACLQGFDNNPYKRRFKRWEYQEYMKILTLTKDEYDQAHRCFQGGFTHTNPFHANQEVWCFEAEDFISSYPAEIVLSDEFAIGEGELIEPVTKEEFERSCKYYFCMFDVIFEDLEPIFLYDNYISSSRCFVLEGSVVANGRVVRASRLATTICMIDMDIIKRCYKWKKMKVANLRRYMKGYLPTDFVKAVLSLYKDKTELKGIESMFVEYMQKKGMCNACFGMSCMAICRSEIKFNNETKTWESSDENAEEQIKKYNESSTRFMFYPWAITITASARRNLWSAIMELKEDYLYADTDSVKFLNPELHRKYFDGYNNWNMRRIEKSAKFHRIPVEYYMPKTIEGKIKPIGMWDFDGSYMCGKFLGSKRNLVTKWDGTNILTVSGLNKKVALPYMEKKFGRALYENFTDELYIPKGYTGKLVHTYIDDETQGEITDYQGVKGYYHELSSVHLEEGDYSLSIADEFVDYILDIQQEETPD